MREKILQAIRKFQIETYLVTEKTVEGAELYFIKKELDMRRMKQDAVSAVTIYRDFGSGQTGTSVCRAISARRTSSESPLDAPSYRQATPSRHALTSSFIVHRAFRGST